MSQNSNSIQRTYCITNLSTNFRGAFGIEPPYLAKALRGTVHPVYLYTYTNEIGKLVKTTLLNRLNKTKATMVSFNLSTMELFVDWTQYATNKHLLSEIAQQIRNIIKSPKSKEFKKFPHLYFKDVAWYHFWLAHNEEGTCIIILIISTSPNLIKLKHPKKFE